MVMSGAIIEKCYDCCYVGFSIGVDQVVGGSPGKWIALTFCHHVTGRKRLGVGACGRRGRVTVNSSNCHGEVVRGWNFHIKMCRFMYYIA